VTPQIAVTQRLKLIGACNMMERIFGIMRRAYYGLFVSVFIGSILSLSYFYVFTNKTDPDWERIGFICMTFLPLAIIVHKAAHWIIWGKVK
jgi:heme/copper-type cytochrome/quinol oxidase subunit 4